MKKLIILVIYLFIHPILVKSQGTFGCDGIIGTIPLQTIKSGFTYDPNINMRYISVNIHYMLKSNGTGNFTETTDGMVTSNSPYNGYTYAEFLINATNQQLSNNPQMNLPPNNTTPNLPIRYRYVLTGVYFHRNSSFYYYPQYFNNIVGTYGVNLGSEINIFLENANGQANGGQANGEGARFVEIKGVWDMYSQYYSTNKLISTSAFARVIMHETCHNLGLVHPIRNNYPGTCCPTCDDECSDTPTIPEMLSIGIDPCTNCGFGTGGVATCDNNLMNYTGDQALTPCQLGKVFDNLTKDANINGTKSYLACSFDTDVLDLCTLGTNQFYNAKSINFPSAGCANGMVTIGQRVIFIAKDGIFLNSGFEVPLSSQFEALILNSCQ